MLTRISAYLIAGLTLACLALSAGKSLAQSHPSPETIALFDADEVGYPGLNNQGVRQAVTALGAAAPPPVSSNWPPRTSEGIQEALVKWSQILAEGKQHLEQELANGTASDATIQKYREDVAGAEQIIAVLEAAAAAIAEHQTGADPENPPNPPPANLPPDDPSQSAPDDTMGGLLSTPEARAKIKAAQDMANEALDMAKHGQYADVRPIMDRLVQTLGISRQLSLAGMDDPAKDLEQKAIDTLKVFSASFADRCKDQSFDPLFATGLLRQNLTIGNDASLEPCTYRLFATVSGSGGWRHCGTGAGDWFYRDKFPDDRSNAKGMGEIAAVGGANKFSFSVAGPDANFKIEGQLELQRREFRVDGGRLIGVLLRLLEHRNSASGRFGLSEAHIEAFGREREWDVTTLNNNMPCDPSEDVWSYAP